MARALWEIVTAGLLEVGDMVSHDPIHTNYPRIVRIRRQGDEIRLDYADGTQEDATRLKMFFRLVKEESRQPADAEHEARIWRRALHIAIVTLYDEKLHVPTAADPQNYARQARQELETEATEAKEREAKWKT